MENVEELSKRGHKLKFPCKLCKGGHLLIDYPCIPKVLEVCSKNSYQLTVDPSTSDFHLPRKNDKVRFPYRLCKGIHHSHILPHIDGASKLLENLTISQ